MNNSPNPTEPPNGGSDQRLVLPVSRDQVTRSMWRVGDLVSRDGTDIHRIESFNEARDLMVVVCMKRPDSGWCEVGDKEYNILGRYEFLNRGNS